MLFISILSWFVGLFAYVFILNLFIYWYECRDGNLSSCLKSPICHIPCIELFFDNVVWMYCICMLHFIISGFQYQTACSLERFLHKKSLCQALQQMSVTFSQSIWLSLIKKLGLCKCHFFCFKAKSERIIIRNNFEVNSNSSSI